MHGGELTHGSYVHNTGMCSGACGGDGFCNHLYVTGDSGQWTQHSMTQHSVLCMAHASGQGTVRHCVARTMHAHLLLPDQWTAVHAFTCCNCGMVKQLLGHLQVLEQSACMPWLLERWQRLPFWPIWP
jgi:hypothetical protein